MHVHRNNLFLMCMATFFGSFSAQAAIRVGGNAIDNVQTFTFPIKAHVYDLYSSILYVGAHQAVADNRYAIAFAKRVEKKQQVDPFVPIAPATINLNGQANQPNPLHAQKISHMALSVVDFLPAAVTEIAPADLCFYQKINAADPKESFLVSVTGINDATGAAQSAGIVGLAAGYTNQTYFFAAVKKNGGTFGEVGGGIALVKQGENKLVAVDAVTGQAGNRALPLNVSTAAIKINGDLASIVANAVDMSFDPYLQRLYFVLQLQAGPGVNDGARALAMAYVTGDQLIVESIAPDAVFTGNDKIVGATGAGEQVSLLRVRTLQTSSRLSYVIVEGGNGAPSAVGNLIFALPLVNKFPEDPLNAPTNPQHGKLAIYNSSPVDSFFNSYPHGLRSRGLTAAAAAPSDVLTMLSVAAHVGGCPVPLDPGQQITDIVAQNDAVYVSVGVDFDGTSQPGLFCSQAILDEKGRIIRWTPWQRAAGSDPQLFGFALDINTASVWLMTGTSVDTVTTVSYTQWTNGTISNQNITGDGLLGGPANSPALGLTGQLSLLLTLPTGSIQNFFSFAQNTPGFGDDQTTPNNQLALLAAVGFNTVVLAETGRNGVASQFRANTGDFATGKQVFTDGTLNGFVAGSKIVAVSGGVLGNIGPLTAAEVSRAPLGSGTNGYLFVGGTNGLAVLSGSTNAGWSTAAGAGLQAGFVGLTSDMSFKTIGSYQQVRKLIGDGTFLYVLTNNTFDRISISSIAAGSVEIVTLATPQAIGLASFSNFSDALVSDIFGLLATSGGLFRVGNGKDITDVTVTGPADLAWTAVHIPEGLGPVTRLLAISPTGQENGLAMNGMLYVLGGAVQFGEARVNRFFVSDVSAGPISDMTIQPLNDLFIKDVPSFLFEFGSYRNFIMTDGLLLFNLRSGDQQIGPMIQSIALYTIADKLAAAQRNQLTVQMRPSQQSSIRHLIRNDPSGAWLIGGSGGLFVNE